MCKGPEVGLLEVLDVKMEQFWSQFWMRLKDNRFQPCLYAKMRCETPPNRICKRGDEDYSP